MARINNHCPHCGENNGAKGDFCPRCGKTYTDPVSTASAVGIDPNQADFEPIIEPAPADDENKEEKKMKVLKVIGYILGGVVALALVTVLLWAGILFIMDKNHSNDTAAAATTAADTIIDETNTTTAIGNSFSLGVPADIDTVDPSVWNEPMQDAVMVDANGTTVYTQSGKDGSVLLKGKIPDGQALVLDSYALSKVVNDKTESYSGGCILVLVGPFDLNSNPISYTDGAAQMIGITSLQSFLDSNVAVKFARGDWSTEKNQWSYEPWALIHVWTPTGYSFNQLVLTYDTDTYPNKTTATDMTVNK